MLLSLLFVLVIVGVIVGLVLKYVPMPQAFRTLVLVVAVIGCVLYAFSAFGIGLPKLP